MCDRNGSQPHTGHAEKLPHLMIIFDKQLRVRWVNTGFERFFSIEKSAVLDMDAKTLVECYLKNQFEHPEEYTRTLLDAYSAHLPVQGLCCYCRCRGESDGRRCFQCFSTLITKGLYAGGRFDQYFDAACGPEAPEAETDFACTTDDGVKSAIASGRQAGESLQSIFNSLEYGIVAVNCEMRVVHANQAAATFLEIPAFRLIGKRLPDIIGPDKAACCLQLEKTLQERCSLRGSRMEWTDSEGQLRDVVLDAMPLFGAAGAFDGAVLVLRDTAALQETGQPPVTETREFHRMVGTSRTMRDLYALIDILAETESTVLITGESGTGKELIADALHERSARAVKPLIKVNCAALPGTLLESELFGHVRGAFTGAVKDAAGRFLMANGGTIFLDEIGDLPPGLQVKLLRVLQQKEIERVGDATPVKVDVRVIAATNQNLKEKIRQGLFREDLYYRLKVVEMHVPPLRRRREDIPALVDFFLKSLQKRFGKNVRGVSEEVRQIFMKHDWPGNVRELEHALEHAFVLCAGSAILKKHLPEELAGKPGLYAEEHTDTPLTGEARELLDALRRTGWNKARSASFLGIDRKTLYRRMKRYHITDPFDRATK